jgi:hypothetical protein
MIYPANLLPPLSGNDFLLMIRISVQQVVDNSNSGLLSSIKPWAGPLAMDASEYGVNLQARWHRLVL